MHEATLGSFAVSVQNCLASMEDYIVIQMRQANCEMGYCVQQADE